MIVSLSYRVARFTAINRFWNPAEFLEWESCFLSDTSLLRVRSNRYLSSLGRPLCYLSSQSRKRKNVNSMFKAVKMFNIVSVHLKSVYLKSNVTKLDGFSFKKPLRFLSVKWVAGCTVRRTSLPLLSTTTYVMRGCPHGCFKKRPEFLR